MKNEFRNTLEYKEIKREETHLDITIAINAIITGPNYKKNSFMLRAQIEINHCSH